MKLVEIVFWKFILSQIVKNMCRPHGVRDPIPC